MSFCRHGPGKTPDSLSSNTDRLHDTVCVYVQNPKCLLGIIMMENSIMNIMRMFS